MDQKKLKYSMKSATRPFVGSGANLRTAAVGPNASRFFHRMDTKLCRDVEGDYWSVPILFVFPNMALVARKLRNMSEFSD